MDGQGTKCRRNIAENFNRLSRAHERYRQTTDRQADDRRTDDSIYSLKRVAMGTSLSCRVSAISAICWPTSQTPSI